MRGRRVGLQVVGFALLLAGAALAAGGGWGAALRPAAAGLAAAVAALLALGLRLLWVAAGPAQAGAAWLRGQRDRLHTPPTVPWRGGDRDHPA